jgi:hypothetical protein
MTKKITTITKFYSDDGKRYSIVLDVEGEYVVDLYESGHCVKSIDCTGKSLLWAEDAADNFCRYIIQKEFE